MRSLTGSHDCVFRQPSRYLVSGMVHRFGIESSPLHEKTDTRKEGLGHERPEERGDAGSGTCRLPARAGTGRRPRTASQQPVYLDPSQPIDRRVDDLISKLTLAEKGSLLGPGRRPSSGSKFRS